MRDGRQEFALQFRGALLVVGALLQLAGQGDDAAVGFLELEVQLGQAHLLPLHFAQRGQQFLVLPLHLLEGILRLFGGEGVGDLRAQGPGDRWRVPRQVGAQFDARAVRARLDGEGVDQPSRASQADPHSGLGDIVAGQDVVEAANARAAVGDDKRQSWRRA